MFSAQFDDLLHRAGFTPIGSLNHRLKLTAWWNPSPAKLLEVLVMNVGDTCCIRGAKSYYMQSVTAEGETWARDIGQLHDFLENHVPEVRVSFSHFRDVPRDLADAEARRRMSIDAPTQMVPTTEQLADLQRQLHEHQRASQTSQALLAASQSPPDLLTGYLRQQVRSEGHLGEQVQRELQSQQQRVSLLRHLQREYHRNGSAAVYTFTINSGVHVIDQPARFADVLTAVTAELLDMDRYHVRQRLQGSRLNIHVEPVDAPAIAWIEQWFGGALSPMQLSRLGRECEALSRAAAMHTMVTPDEPIVVEGHVRYPQKRLGAHVVSTIVSRLDRTHGSDGDPLDPDNISCDAMPLWLGHRLDASGKVIGPAVLPLKHLTHVYVSGTTGSGKSFLARVFIEEAAKQVGLNIVVLDPRNQFCGALVPEDRPQIIARYADFDMQPGDARGLDFDYFAPGLAFAPKLPDDLAQLAFQRSIVSFKGLSDVHRCATATDILNRLFARLSVDESDRPRLLILVDEAQLLTRKRVDASARDAAMQAERALDRVAREGRKFGMILTLVSQTMKDFAREMASLRQMTSTKIFMRNSDLEIDYAAQILGDGRPLAQLPTGTAIAHNATWGMARIRVRPPHSKVFDLPESVLRTVLKPVPGGRLQLSAEAETLHALIADMNREKSGHIHLSKLAAAGGITSRRKLHAIVTELEQAGMIRTLKLPERGQPRIIELINHDQTTVNKL